VGLGKMRYSTEESLGIDIAIETAHRCILTCLGDISVELDAVAAAAARQGRVCPRP
jgi:hypothetical protein